MGESTHGDVLETDAEDQGAGVQTLHQCLHSLDLPCAAQSALDLRGVHKCRVRQEYTCATAPSQMLADCCPSFHGHVEVAARLTLNSVW